jgi:transposase
MDMFCRRWKMRTIGIDLALKATHKAVVADDRGTVITPVIRFHTRPEELQALMERAREGKADDEPLRVVMEPTGLAWLPLASYFIQRGVTVHLVSTQQSADLRKFYSKHAKSDRISARVLVRFPWVLPQDLQSLELADASYSDGQRWCKQREELADLITAIKNRVQAWERAFWPGLDEVVDDLFCPWMRRWREAFYDPWKLQEMAPRSLAAFLVEAGAGVEKAERLASGLHAVAHRAVTLFGTPQGGSSPYANYASLQDQILRELRLLAAYEREHKSLQRRVHKLYRCMHPTRNLETIKGVGEEGASVYLFFVGKVERFARQKHFRGWSGMVPKSDQSGDVDKKGLRMTKAGPDLVKKYAYINAEVARQWDPQIAAIYHDQMVNNGKHHVQAVCHCATHLLDRVRAVLRDERPYELRDVDGTPVSWQEARSIIAEMYQVPEEVRKRSSARERRRRRDRDAERKQRRREVSQVGERLTLGSHLN